MAKKAIETSGLSEVKQEDKKRWWEIAFIWAGSVCCVPALMVGGIITTGLTFSQAFLAMMIAYGICVVMMILMSVQSTDLGVPTVVAVSGAFGKKGSSYVISAIISFCFICWFGFQAALCGEAFAGILNTFGIPLPGLLSTILWGGGYVHHRRGRH
ncbi:cytosine permease [uncultured Oscillibacter sp.]|uniref:cytosine permease n=1 Tax=uncultured Oscillibacter sp. TaxID=876091 RepID=UPI0026247DEB|nr:cytosine permease [uncultured Oscillibacter sp.]